VTTRPIRNQQHPAHSAPFSVQIAKLQSKLDNDLTDITVKFHA